MDKPQPVSGRPGIFRFGGDDLHNVARPELGGQGDQTSVHLGTRAAMAHLGMDGVGEVHRCGTPGQGFDLTLWGENEHQILV